MCNYIREMEALMLSKVGGYRKWWKKVFDAREQYPHNEVCWEVMLAAKEVLEEEE